MLPIKKNPLISPRMLQDAGVVLQWAKEYISQPHPELGRDGPICPFVPPSIDRDAFYIALHYEADGSHADCLREILLTYAEWFACEFPAEKPENVYKTILVVFPGISTDWAPVLDCVHREVKSAFVKKGLMLGQFHQNCLEPAARNPFFRVSTSPIPLVAIRNMSVHDILFLDTCPEWFAEYESRFGCKYAAGKVTSVTYKQIYARARETFLSITAS